MSAPTGCPECEKIFLADPTLQAEMLHLAITMGVGYAKAELDERLNERHVRHIPGRDR